METTRRNFLKLTATAAVGNNFISGTVQAAEQSKSIPVPSDAFIDTNVMLGRWPFRRCPLDETPALVTKLREQGITQAWAGTFDGLLHKDVATANARLADECRRHGNDLLLPFGSINPMLPAWEEDFRRCVEDHQMRGVRLHPNYHGYKLDDPALARLLARATERNLIVQIALIMEDERTQHPLLQVPPVDTAPLVDLLKQLPKLRIELLNAFRTLRGEPLLRLAAAGVHFEIAMLEGVNGVTNLMKLIPSERVLFGSHAPLFYFESAALKLKESVLTAEHLAAIRAGNASRLIAA